jgi:hypothetical protein
MSNASTPRPSSQQKKTALSILQDPIQPKKPDPPKESAAFKRPTVADLRAPSPDAPAAAFARPTLDDMKDFQVPFTLDQRADPQYRPYTVDDYRELQQMQEHGERGGLGPSLDEEWERKQQMRARLMQFGQKARQDNKAAIPRRGRPREEPKRAPTKRDKMRQYAGNIPRPRAAQKEKAPEAKKLLTPAPVAAKYDIEAELHRHEHFVARVDDMKVLVGEYLD